ncbi:MAG TPA: SDR family oxidoreductase [Actinobacteria bacterium]|jgi:3-oxoacyl-[acyl-carrier protein] reductase|nr:SDR family oxidoreductase [Actinomycetota bacterium]
MKELKGKVAIVTGSAGGIGEATAFAVAREDAEAVIIADLNVDRGNEVAEKIRKETGAKCEFIKTDISDSEEIRSLFKKIFDRFGRIDILINCAGICDTLPIEEIDEKQWDKMLGINLRGTYLCCREALILMKKMKYGKIVNVTSISGQIGGIATGIDYCTSKGGIITLTMSLAKIGGPYNITVNAVSPGFIDTEMTREFTHFDPETVPLRRIGRPDEVADVIVFLASDKSRYVTGTIINVNGGVFMG